MSIQLITMTWDKLNQRWRSGRMRQGTNKRKKTERKKKEDIGKPSQRSKQEATSVEKAKGRWMREKDRGRVHPWFTRSSYWAGKKGGQTGYPKHRIVYSSRSRWHVTWMHNQYSLLSSVSSRPISWLCSLRMCSPEECSCQWYCCAATVTNAIATVVATATRYHHVAIRG